METVGLISSFFGILIFSSDCFGAAVFLLIEVMRLEEAKRPVRSGSNGSSRFELSVATPKNPERKKIIVDKIINSASFSSYSKKSIIKIRKNPSIFCINGYVASRKR